MRALLTAVLLSSVAASGTAVAQAYRDGRPVIGAGVTILAPELRETPRGRAFALRFDANGDGRLQRREAAAANRALALVAADDLRDGERVAIDEHGGWDRQAMRDYRFRQTPRGATMTLAEQVLFATDSAVLRPGALDRLRPLVAYLRDNPGVRVAIDGHTDARGGDAHNQLLSERRSASVRAAFDTMGVTRARFQVVGHGEAEPVASNATPQGMRRNRRVDVTLLGRRATEFSQR